MNFVIVNSPGVQRAYPNMFVVERHLLKGKFFFIRFLQYSEFLTKVSQNKTLSKQGLRGSVPQRA